MLGKTKTLYCFVCRSILSVKEFFGHWRENTGTRNRVTLSLIPIDIAQIKKLVEILILCCEVLGTLATSCLHGHFQLPVPSFVYFSVYRTVTERELQHYLLWLRSVEWQWWLYSDIVCLSFRPTTYDVFLAVRRAKENERQGHFKKTAGKKKKSTVSVSGIVCLSCTWTALVVALRICGFRSIMMSTLVCIAVTWIPAYHMNCITFLKNTFTTIYTVLCGHWYISLLASIQFNAEIPEQQFMDYWICCFLRKQQIIDKEVQWKCRNPSLWNLTTVSTNCTKQLVSRQLVSVVASQALKSECVETRQWFRIFEVFETNCATDHITNVSLEVLVLPRTWQRMILANQRLNLWDGWRNQNSLTRYPTFGWLGQVEPLHTKVSEWAIS